LGWRSILRGRERINHRKSKRIIRSAAGVRWIAGRNL
jgi:hypothetical protein